MHSISDEYFVLSFAFVLDASTFSSADLRRIGFVGGNIGSIGAASLIGFSRSKFRLSPHPARARARSIANSHFIFDPRHAGSGTHSAQDALDAGGKKSGLKRRVADVLISEWGEQNVRFRPLRILRQLSDHRLCTDCGKKVKKSYRLIAAPRF